MVAKIKIYQDTLWFNGLCSIVLALIIGLVILNPLWSVLQPPFPIPRIFPAITAPVDGPFYLQNAEHGYQWATKNPLSLWFHPLLSCVVGLMPHWLPDNIWFWIISVAFAVGCIVLSYRLIGVWKTPTDISTISVRLLPLILLVPGGLEIATGNAEIPALFFTLALLLSVLYWQKWWLTVLFATFAILTKPNALYMIPILAVYLYAGIRLERNPKLWGQALIGIFTLLIVWGMWISYVGLKTGDIGTYLKLRELTSQYAAHDFSGFFNHLANAFLYNGDIRDQVRYSVALIIPIVNLLIIGQAPLKNDRDRYALAAGNITMLALALFMGNPNKIIIYTTTLPGYFSVHILFVGKIIKKISLPDSSANKAPSLVAAVLYAAYCIAMLVVYILGTPQGWYY